MTVADCCRSRPARLLGNPATIHHLIELYEYLIPADPAAVFDIVHALLLGPAAHEGYHHERLANSVVVRIIRRQIADQRSIFDDPERRARLISILGLFSDVGWPDALKLMYELPDLLREQRAMSWPTDER